MHRVQEADDGREEGIDQGEVKDVIDEPIVLKRVLLNLKVGYNWTKDPVDSHGQETLTEYAQLSLSLGEFPFVRTNDAHKD